MMVAFVPDWVRGTLRSVWSETVRLDAMVEHAARILCCYQKRSSLKTKELFYRHVWDRKQFFETRII